MQATVSVPEAISYFENPRRPTPVAQIFHSSIISISSDRQYQQISVDSLFVQWLPRKPQLLPLSQQEERLYSLLTCRLQEGI